MENGVLLDATMVRCAANRSASKYEPACVNAREAINRIATAEEETRRAALEKESERKRRALRRAQEAASQARRRAEEAERLREEAAYIAQFEGRTIEPGNAQPRVPAGSTLPPSPPQPVPTQAAEDDVETPPNDQSVDAGTDLDAIREELKRRQNQQ